MEETVWPDVLQKPDPAQVHARLYEFWDELARLAVLLPNGQLILAAEATHRLRAIIVELMLALNGIARPAATNHLNTYLGNSQRQALEKTLLLPAVDHAAFIAQAVALVTIYRWYAPQLLDRYGGAYPELAEATAWRELAARLPDWPLTLTTD